MESPRRPSAAFGVIETVGGCAAAAGGLLPWAQVHLGDQAQSLLGSDFTLTLSGVSVDATFAGVVMVAGVLAAAAGLLVVADGYRFRLIALLGTIFGVTAIIGAILGLTKGSTTVASSAEVLGPLSGIASGIANLAGLSGLVVVDIGFGIWVSVAGGAVAALAGVFAYRQTMR